MATTSGIIRRGRRRSIIGPVILIAIGGLLLAENFGFAGGDLWRAASYLWPLLLVGIGLEYLFGRGSIGGIALVGALGAIIVSIAAWHTYVGPLPQRGGFFLDGAPLAAGVERISEDLGDTRVAAVDLGHSAGKLSVSALPSDSSRLIEGELHYRDNSPIARDVNRAGDRTSIRLRTREDRVAFDEQFTREDWSVRLSPKVATELTISSGASAMDLDLTDLNVTQLRVNTGASGARIALPRAAGRTGVTIKAGAAGVNLSVPEGVAARITTRGALAGIDVDQARFLKTGPESYESPDYGRATNQVDIGIDAGVSGISVR